MILNFMNVFSIFTTISAYRWTTPTSPKLPFSLSPIHTFRLASRELDIYADLKAYNSSHFENFPLIQEYLEDYENSTMKKDHRPVEQHPVLVYRMIKRFVDYVTPLLQHLKKSRNKSHRQLLQKLEERKDVFYPNDIEQLFKTAENVLRIQHVSDIKADDMINGRFMNVSTGIGLTPQQTLEFASSSYELGYYYIALDYLNHLALDNDADSVQLRDAIQADVIHNHDRTHGKNKKEFHHFQKPFSQGPSPPLKNAEYSEWLDYGGSHGLSREIRLKILAQCSHQHLHQLTTLTCWNDHKSQPYFTIAPLLTEQISKSPDIWLFHEVIGPKNIKAIELAATSQLEENVLNPINTSPIIYSTLPKHIEDPLVSKMEGIFKLSMTGLEAEGPRYAIYHLGGEADHHHDAFRTPTPGSKLFADVLASFILYLEDTELGGETVYPLVNAAVKPTKGSLLFWYNYHKDGVIDWKTIHGICPPILGIKTYVNGYILSANNMFNYPCTLTPSH